MDKNTNFQNQKPQTHKEEEDQEEETLSLCDFPLNSSNHELNKNKHSSNNTTTPPDHHHTRRSTSEPSDFFEFFNHHLNSNTNTMSHAEDIIFCGKLIPYRNPNFDDKILKSVSDHYDSINLSRRYCESLPDQVNRITKSKNSRFTRSSRSLDCKRSQLRRNSSLVMKSEASDIHRSFSKGSAKSEALRGCNSKPRWYALVFGLVKFPPEMDIRDMKNRQVRRNPGSLFAAAGGGGRIPADRRSSWGYDLLRVLSCKSHASVGVAATSSIGLVPQV